MLSLEKIIKLRNKISRDAHIIVEGKKDKVALEKLRFGNILAISGKSNEKIIETIITKRAGHVVILTDFDKEGEKKHKELKRLFEKEGIKIDFTVRDNFKRTFKVRKIEEATSTANGVDEYYQGSSHSTTKKTFFRNRFIKRKKRKAGRNGR
jgi:5S rRNA maturation endonuclease (ribonuclease M5)